MRRDVGRYLIFIVLPAVALTAAGLFTLVCGVGGLAAEMDQSRSEKGRRGAYVKQIRSAMASRAKRFRNGGGADYVWPKGSEPWGVGGAEKRNKYGYFVAENGASIGWARLDDGRVIGYDMEPFRYEDRRSLYAIGTVMVAMLFLVLAVGGWMLLRSAMRSRRELEVKDSFLDLVSHELNTPLGSIVPLSAALADGGIRDEARRKEALDAIRRESARMARMIDELLTAVRIRNGRISYARESFDLREVAQSAAGLARMRYPEIAIRVDGGAPVMALADRDRTEQVAINLIENACRHAGGDEVEVACGCAPEGCVRMEVRDRGEGMTEEQRRHAFDRFYQADPESEQGLGLGLNIVAGFVKGMGGAVSVAARDGGGSVFAVALPGSRGAGGKARDDG